MNQTLRIIARLKTPADNTGEHNVWSDGCFWLQNPNQISVFHYHVKFLNSRIPSRSKDPL